ncbi:MAG TPA: hypothetical protein VGG28_03550, partial [Kofleriaceae bacterium]
MQLATRLLLTSLLALVACGNNNGNGDDDGNGDAGSGNLDCGYTEMSDATNNAMSEASGLTVATESVLCGQVDTGHFGSGVAD